MSYTKQIKFIKTILKAPESTQKQLHMSHHERKVKYAYSLPKRSQRLFSDINTINP